MLHMCTSGVYEYNYLIATSRKLKEYYLSESTSKKNTQTRHATKMPITSITRSIMKNLSDRLSKLGHEGKIAFSAKALYGPW
jgi:hypothetical protein